MGCKGKRFEDIALKYLIKKGYKLLSRNWRYRNLEIDLVMLKDGTIVFVEVKGSIVSDENSLASRVDAKKLRNLYRAMEAYIMLNNLKYKDMRLDVILVLGNEVRHLENVTV